MQRWITLICLPLMISASHCAAQTATEKPATTAPAANPLDTSDPTVGYKKSGTKADRFQELHQQYLDRAKQGNIDVVFLGDSITERWNSAPDVWKRYEKYNAVNFGIGGDKIEHVIWRIENGELDGFSAKLVVLMIGTNNSNTSAPERIATGVTHIVKLIKEKQPNAKVLLLAIFPRGAKNEGRQPETVAAVNPMIAKLDDGGKTVKFLDIGKGFLDDSGKVRKDLMPDYLHPNAAGYQVWADEMQPTLDEMLKE